MILHLLTIQRTLFLDRQDIKNITRDFEIDYVTERYNNDAISVQPWVKDIQKYTVFLQSPKSGK